LATQGDDIGVYKAYIKDTKSLKYLSELFLFSNMNNINLSTIPKYLPTLTKVKKIIIAYIYIYLQVVQVHGQQY
jgi:cadmium resistance protein CadD (predicted permease)